MKEDSIPILRSLGIQKNYAKNEMLFHADTKASGFFYILSGEIRIYKIDCQGKEIEIVRLKQGDYFGEAIMFAGEDFPFFSQAVKNSRVLFIPRSSIELAIKKNPDVARFFLFLLAKKCTILTQRLETLTLHTVRERIIRYLLTHCCGGHICTVKLNLSKSELAKALGTISATLSRNLKKLQEERLIEVKGKEILVRNCIKMRKEIST
ncbi:MAG: Crp/Fnr family transcriptional regulator [Candidatus Aminicenantes bacterium]|nr:Crp/Fnr family transcriptional regulator [Candidatus Aminicenantes bacterium]